VRGILVLVLSVLVLDAIAPLYAQKEPKPSKHQLALLNLKAARARLVAAQKAWAEIPRSYGHEPRTTLQGYLALINVARAKADVCEAENDAGVARCKTTSLETDHSYLLDIIYFHSDGSSVGTHYYFAEHEDGTYEESEHDYRSSS
jgi:hypothetical protein